MTARLGDRGYAAVLGAAAKAGAITRAERLDRRGLHRLILRQRRRPPFEPGHTLSTKHGAYATLQLQPRADELAQQLREAMGAGYEARFEGAIAGAAMVGASVERAMVALDAAADVRDLRRLDQDARGWMRLWFNALGLLGLTPASAARLGLLNGAGDLSMVLAMQQRRRGAS